MSADDFEEFFLNTLKDFQRLDKGEQKGLVEFFEKQIRVRKGGK